MTIDSSKTRQTNATAKKMFIVPTSMRSDAAERVIDGKLTRLLADGTWVPMATVHFVAVTAVLLVGWMTWRERLEPVSYGQALCRARWVIPNNSSQVKQQDRALTLARR